MSKPPFSDSMLASMSSAYQKLLGLADFIDDRDMWPHRRDLGTSVFTARSSFGSYLDGLIQTMISADGQVKHQEARYIRKVLEASTYRDLLDNETLKEEVENYMEDGAWYEVGAPLVLDCFVEADRAYGLNMAETAATTIFSLAMLAMLADGQEHEAELHALDELEQNLQDALEYHGIFWVYVSPDLVENEIDEEERSASITTQPPVLKGPPAGRDLDTLVHELNSLVGLNSVKNEVASLINFVRVRRMRSEHGITVPPISLHLVFSGNPGTGKTTVARLLAEIFASIGLLSKGHLVETDRSGLVGQYVGQTSTKVTEVVDSALGGILFIDEAYALVSKLQGDYGQEAIDVLLKRMEDDRDDLLVIVAGYSEQMETFLEANPGLRSRFNRFIHFPDYSSAELTEIFDLLCNQNSYELAAEARTAVSQLLDFMHSERGDNFGNGRTVRNLFEKVLANQSDRLMTSGILPSKEELQVISLADVPSHLPDQVK